MGPRGASRAHTSGSYVHSWVAGATASKPRSMITTSNLRTKADGSVSRCAWSSAAGLYSASAAGGRPSACAQEVSVAACCACLEVVTIMLHRRSSAAEVCGFGTADGRLSPCAAFCALQDRPRGVLERCAAAHRAAAGRTPACPAAARPAWRQGAAAPAPAPPAPGTCRRPKSGGLAAGKWIARISCRVGGATKRLPSFVLPPHCPTRSAHSAADIPQSPCLTRADRDVRINMLPVVPRQPCPHSAVWSANSSSKQYRRCPTRRNEHAVSVRPLAGCPVAAYLHGREHEHAVQRRAAPVSSASLLPSPHSAPSALSSSVVADVTRSCKRAAQDAELNTIVVPVLYSAEIHTAHQSTVVSTVAVRQSEIPSTLARTRIVGRGRRHEQGTDSNA